MFLYNSAGSKMLKPAELYSIKNICQPLLKNLVSKTSSQKLNAVHMISTSHESRQYIHQRPSSYPKVQSQQLR
jgi:hypothetical protein